MTSLRDHLKKSPHRTRLERLLFSTLPTLSGTILDIGSRNRRYDHLLASRPVAVDLVADPLREVIAGDVTNLQFEDRSFDAVICLEVLEYVADPKQAISEIARVLKPGGVLVLSVPFMFKEHEDCQRYTGAYLKSLLGEFEIAQFETVGGSFTVLLTIWWGKVKAISFRPLRYLASIALLPLLMMRSSRRPVTTYASGYFVIATKRA